MCCTESITAEHAVGRAVVTMTAVAMLWQVLREQALAKAVEVRQTASGRSAADAVETSLCC